MVGLFRDAVAGIAEWSWPRRLAVAAALLSCIAVTVLVEIPSVATLQDWAGAAGNPFVVLFWVGYVALTQFPVPRTILTLASGVLFGPWQGALIALTATTASAALSLLVVRGLLGDWMSTRLTHPAVAGVNTRLEERGWLAVTSLRMIAGVPFSVLNYAAALTSVPLGMFTLATFVGSAPGTAVTVLLGDTLAGDTDPVVIGLTVLLAAVGVVGLAVDQRLPVKSVT
ncbi:TVP38/TMEM64 family protein [Corynebacterium hylobatis]|uniref:TVP38/TMEM64 family membrane protein n=2 Tax=Corynebacterium hylobatis TaxID=1859290 RepID=A0A430HYG5_9CORY|nr:TVP38/TMEM64 family protein [Corynebacterium hylobatis]RSZ63588.1 TVP38/TMEM64 family protein [Corynebacterium hylobatis]